MAEGKVTAESEVTSEDSVEENARYVLHGGLVLCECGSRESHLQVPKCHGTYMHDMPIMVNTDTTAIDNIQPFGYCTCMENPDRQEIIESIMQEVEDQTHDLLDVAMDCVNAVGNFFSKTIDFFTGNEEKEEKKDEYADMLIESVMVPCNPDKFSIIWNDASEDLIINGKKALTTKCTIVCEKCGKQIFIVDDGQENAAYEQQSKQDLSDWKEGDPMPDASEGNLQELERLGKEDTELYQKMKEQVESKKEIETQKRYCQDEEEYNALVKKEKKLNRQYKNNGKE